jgi:hypothetical protein
MAEDNLTAEYFGTVPASGALTLKITPTRMQQWLIKQVTNEMVGVSASAICTLRKTGVYLVSPLKPDRDTAADPPYVLLRYGDWLTVEWTGAAVGLSGRVFVLYDAVDYS